MTQAQDRSNGTADALAAADRLWADGRAFDAVQLLTDANHNARSAAIETKLVQLRHETFATLELQDAAGPAPDPIIAAPRASATLPELPAAELTASTLRDGLSRYGCVLVRELISSARAEFLVTGIDNALGAFDAAVDGAPRRETSPWYVPFRPNAGKYRVGGRRGWVRASGGVWTADSPRMMFELIDLIDETGVGAVVTEYLGERPALSANKCTLRRVPIDSNTDWHQDGAFLGAEVRSVNLWVSLSHCGVDAPGLDILPRRLDEIAPTGTEGAYFDWAVAPSVVDELAGTAPIVRPEFGPGDALLFDHMFLHRTAVAPDMTKERYAIETWLFAPSVYPDGQIPLVY